MLLYVLNQIYAMYFLPFIAINEDMFVVNILRIFYEIGNKWKCNYGGQCTDVDNSSLSLTETKKNKNVCDDLHTIRNVIELDSF